jgi:hypothetical protein
MTFGSDTDKRPVLHDPLWTTRYEEVRRQSGTETSPSDRGWGYELLIRRGLVAWMRTWPTPKPEATQPRTIDRPIGVVDTASIHSHEVVVVLANMILDLRREVPA